MQIRQDVTVTPHDLLTTEHRTYMPFQVHCSWQLSVKHVSQQAGQGPHAFCPDYIARILPGCRQSQTSPPLLLRTTCMHVLLNSQFWKGIKTHRCCIYLWIPPTFNSM